MPARDVAMPSNNDAVATKRLLILGGSGGAVSLNENVPRALYKLGSKLDGWHIVHQAGQANVEATQQLYNKLGLTATVHGFIDDMPAVLAETDLAVCRAGGTTLAELAAAGVPAVLLPYPHAADDHQRHNAQVFATAGAAKIVDTRQSGDRLDGRLAAVLTELMGRGFDRVTMAAAMRALARPEATADVTALILDLVSGQARNRNLAAVA